MSQPKQFIFGSFTLDVAEHRLCCHGEVIELTPMEFNLLKLFVENPGRLLPKEEIWDQLWPDFDSGADANLKRLVHVLRQKKLGAGHDEQRYIATVPKVGYRFVAKVETDESACVESRPGPNGAGVAEPAKLAATSTAPRASLPATQLFDPEPPAPDKERGGPAANREGWLLDPDTVFQGVREVMHGSYTIFKGLGKLAILVLSLLFLLLLVLFAVGVLWWAGEAVWQVWGRLSLPPDWRLLLSIALLVPLLAVLAVVVYRRLRRR